MLLSHKTLGPRVVSVTGRPHLMRDQLNRALVCVFFFPLAESVGATQVVLGLAPQSGTVGFFQ